MKRKEIKKRIEEVLRYHNELEAQWAVLEKAIGVDTSIGVGNLSWQLFDSYADSVSREIGDPLQYLAWFIFDNQKGKRGLKASTPSAPKPKRINDVDDLVELIKNYK